MNRRNVNRLWLLATILLIGFGAVGCAVSTNPITGNQRAYAYTWQEEIAIGRDADPQIVAQYGTYGSAQLATYIDSLGQALLEVSHLRRPGADPEWQRTPFTFRVLDSPVVNAFALPGGFVYVTRGLLAHLNNEAQLAVVLGHEIGHVAGRHGSKRAMNQMFGQAAILAGAVGGQALFGGNAAENVIGLGSDVAGLMFLSYGRNDERESDDLGVEYASLLGYDAAEGSAFFRSLRRMSEKSGQEIPSFLSTHPDPGEREQTIQRLAAEWEAQVPGNRLEKRNYRGITDGIVWGEDPRQGFTREGMFFHPDLRFQFPVPGGFRVMNQPSRVVLVSSNEQAFMVFTIESEHATARLAAEAFAAQEGMTAVTSGAAPSTALPGWVVGATVATQNGEEVRVRAHYIEYSDAVYSFTGVAAAADYDTWKGNFELSSNNFRPLTDQRILATKPVRMYWQPASSTASFQSLVAGTLPEDVTADEMAIVNQLNLGDQVSRGTPIKLLHRAE